ncbi:MAG: ROK family protein [Planctomycetes bacterium]|nr:ROK family protein [Planctomycetota bacterium]
MSSQPGDLRLANARRVLTVALHDWPCTKPELARRTGLSQMTIGKVVEELLGLGLLERAPDPPVAAHGRPAARVRPRTRPAFVGIEIGVRTTVLYCFGLAGEPDPPRRKLLPMPSGLDPLRAELRAFRREFCPDPIETVLVAVPGVLDVVTPSIVYSANLHWSEGTALLTALGEEFDATVCPVQEAQALALGHLATREGADSFLLVDLGDGIGSTIVSEGRLLGGPLPLSGEIGHTAVPGNDRRCGCGAIGCIETLAGRGGLLTTFRRDSGKSQADWSTMKAALEDADLPGWLDETLDSLAMVVAGALNLLGFAEVVFCGDLAQLHPRVMPHLQERIRQHSLLGRFGELQARGAPVQRQLGLLAAAVERVLLAER